MITEKYLIDYFLRTYPDTLVRASDNGHWYEILYIGSISDQEIEDWIIEKANSILKLKYLCSLLESESGPRYPYVPELKKPMQNVKVILDPSRATAKLEFVFPKIWNSIEIPIETMINTKGYVAAAVNNIRALSNNRVEMLTLSLGKELELQERLEEYIKKWWNM